MRISSLLSALHNPKIDGTQYTIIFQQKFLAFFETSNINHIYKKTHPGYCRPFGVPGLV